MSENTKARIPINNKLIFDFDPKVFLTGGGSIELSRHYSPIDAVFIPTRNRSHYLDQAINIVSPSTPIYCLPTKPGDIGIPHLLPKNVSALDFREPAFLDMYMKLSLHNCRLCVSPPGSWDLPIKRNFAIWFSARNGYKKILLLDDDIRNLTPRTFINASSALENYKLCGPLITEFPDHSIVSHLEIGLGEPSYTFVSGSALFIRITDDLGFFPPIYNEDWIFLLPHLLKNEVISIDKVFQEPYDPFVYAERAAFQEPGEVIADSLFIFAKHGVYDKRKDATLWNDFIHDRRSWLLQLKGMVSNDAQRKCVEEALRINLDIDSEQCIDFIRSWETDVEVWNQKIRS